MKYFLDMKEEYSEVKSVNKNGNKFKIGDVYFEYVPEGFKHEVLSESEKITIIDFINNNEYFSLKVTKNNWTGKINTENSQVEELIINNKDMVYYENNEEKFISWQELDKVCLLSTNCEKELLIEIVNGIIIN